MQLLLMPETSGINVKVCIVITYITLFILHTWWKVYGIIKLSEGSVSLISKTVGLISSYLFEPLILIYLTSEAVDFKYFIF